jgi:type II secretory pathway pseudopilin PulG
LSNYKNLLIYVLIFSLGINIVLVLMLLRYNSQNYFKDSIEVIGILATIVFALLVWIATKKNADATEASFSLSKNILDLQREGKIKIRNGYLNTLYNETYDVLQHICDMKSDNINFLVKIDNIPLIHSLSIEELASSFTQEELDMICSTWQNVKDLKRIYKSWVSDGGDKVELDKAIEKAATEFQILTDYLGNGRLHLAFGDSKI